MDYRFDTPEPVDLHVELDRGRLSITATDTGQSAITVEGEHPERLEVSQDGPHLRAVVKRRTPFELALPLQVEVTVPVGSRVVVRTGSADVATLGALADVVVTTGSGEVEVAEAGSLSVTTGSGDVRAGTLGSLLAKTGSGHVRVGEVAGRADLNSGSGRLELGHARADACLRTASGSIRIDAADSGLVLNSASGSIEVRRVAGGEVSARSASGSVSIGVPPGLPVWTDISTLTGRISSDLAGAGRPEPGQNHLRLRVSVVSGNVRLSQLTDAEVLR